MRGYRLALFVVSGLAFLGLLLWAVWSKTDAAVIPALVSATIWLYLSATADRRAAQRGDDLRATALISALFAVAGFPIGTALSSGWGAFLVIGGSMTLSVALTGLRGQKSGRETALDWTHRIGGALLLGALLTGIGHWLIGWEPGPLLGWMYVSGLGGMALMTWVQRHRRRATQWW
jgi:hypothetical protein